MLLGRYGNSFGWNDKDANNNARTDENGNQGNGVLKGTDVGTNHEGGNQSNGKVFDVSDALDKSLNLTTDAIVGAQAAGRIGWRQMVKDVPVLKQLGVATGIIGFANHAVNFYKKPNWKDGLEMTGQLGVWGLKIALPESYIIDAVEFGYNNDF